MGLHLEELADILRNTGAQLEQKVEELKRECEDLKQRNLQLEVTVEEKEAVIQQLQHFQSLANVSPSLDPVKELQDFKDAMTCVYKLLDKISVLEKENRELRSQEKSNDFSFPKSLDSLVSLFNLENNGGNNTPSECSEGLVELIQQSLQEDIEETPEEEPEVEDTEPVYISEVHEIPPVAEEVQVPEVIAEVTEVAQVPDVGVVEEEEAEEIQEEPLEVEEKTIRGKSYYVSTREDRSIYEMTDDGDIGALVGKIQKVDGKSKAVWFD